MGTPHKIDVNNLTTATAQEVFDWVAYNLLRQNEQASVDGRCRYITPDGKRCAAGFLLPDGSPELESRSNWGALVIEGKVTEAHRGLIARLQQLHDYNPPDVWQSALNGLAKDRGLLPYPREQESDE